jgi:hypothetical protein
MQENNLQTGEGNKNNLTKRKQFVLRNPNGVYDNKFTLTYLPVYLTPICASVIARVFINHHHRHHYHLSLCLLHTLRRRQNNNNNNNNNNDNNNRVPQN